MDFDKILDDDQLIKNPVKLIGADYKDGQLILELNKDVNSKWINAFQSIENYSYILGYAPVNYRFDGNKAIILFLASAKCIIRQKFLQKFELT